jgi:hypothetical protein
MYDAAPTGPMQVAEEIRQDLAAFLQPLIEQLDAQIDRRFVRTALRSRTLGRGRANSNAHYHPQMTRIWGGGSYVNATHFPGTMTIRATRTLSAGDRPPRRPSLSDPRFSPTVSDDG